jgi:hypothetical protein
VHKYDTTANRLQQSSRGERFTTANVTECFVFMLGYLVGQALRSDVCSYAAFAGHSITCAYKYDQRQQAQKQLQVSGVAAKYTSNLCTWWCVEMVGQVLQPALWPLVFCNNPVHIQNQHNKQQTPANRYN